MKRWLVYSKLIFLFFCFALLNPAFADSSLLSPTETLKRVHNNQLTLIDVRSPQEWHETGIAKGAKTITIHGPLGPAGFVAKMKASLRGKLDQPIALICAVGVRSTRAQNVLKRAGIKIVYNVREGMLGNSKDGPGWLKRGLPITR
ncbi:rhodanese-like domain-containing protein [bacterium]|nr:rhodanese-like domain-containing protein [bacterium]